METVGTLTPDTEAAARERYAELAPLATTVTRAVTRAVDVAEALDADAEQTAVVTAHEAIFAGLLAVSTGTRAEFDEWLAARDELETDRIGSEHVDNVAWHPVPFAGVVAAATFQEHPTAAVETLRRRVFGRYYRPIVDAERDADTAAARGTGDDATDQDGTGGR